MKIAFSKYQGTGNDFILIDNRDEKYSSITTAQVKAICHRRFGIGADGVMLLNTIKGYDFEMKYYNSDGNESSMCGNGGRCIVAFAKQLGIITNKANFIAIDGPHTADITDDNVSLGMSNVNEIKTFDTFYQLDTGSPHYVCIIQDVMQLDIKKEGALIRYSPMFEEEGINVNFVEQNDNNALFVATYERGVEDETYSCGTGVTACALVQMSISNTNKIDIQTKGGKLSVTADKEGEGYKNIILAGPATFVYTGEINV